MDGTGYQHTSRNNEGNEAGADNLYHVPIDNPAQPQQTMQQTMQQHMQLQFQLHLQQQQHQQQHQQQQQLYQHQLHHQSLTSLNLEQIANQNIIKDLPQLSSTIFHQPETQQQAQQQAQPTQLCYGHLYQSLGNLEMAGNFGDDAFRYGNQHEGIGSIDLTTNSELSLYPDSMDGDNSIQSNSTKLYSIQQHPTIQLRTSACAVDSTNIQDSSLNSIMSKSQSITDTSVWSKEDMSTNNVSNNGLILNHLNRAKKSNETFLSAESTNVAMKTLAQSAYQSCSLIDSANVPRRLVQLKQPAEAKSKNLQKHNSNIEVPQVNAQVDCVDSTAHCPVNPILENSASTQANRTFSIFGSTSRKRIFSGPQLSMSEKSCQRRLKHLVKPLITSENFAKINASNKSNCADIGNVKEADALLHNACRLYPNTLAVVESALQLDKNSIRTPIPLTYASSSNVGVNSFICSNKDTHREKEEVSAQIKPIPTSASTATGVGLSKLSFTEETYAYPINIALKSEACVDVIRLLAREGPDVICLPDGRERACCISIAVALGYDKDVIEMLVSINPKAIELLDRHNNTALHTAVWFGNDSKGVISYLCETFPDALKHLNCHGHTPYDVAVKSPFCSEDVVDYLQRLLFAEEETEHSILSELDRLDDALMLPRGI